MAGLGADAATLNPLLGGDALDPLIDAAARAGPEVFAVVRTSIPGPPTCSTCRRERPLFERLAELVAERAPRLAGAEPLSGMGAVVGATEPRHLPRMRELPDAIFLLPGVGAQGGRPETLAQALGPHPASILVGGLARSRVRRTRPRPRRVCATRSERCADRRPTPPAVAILAAASGLLGR